MSTKRLSDNNIKALPAKRGRKKKTDDDFDSDTSDHENDIIDNPSGQDKVEVLIANDDLDAKLPEVFILFVLKYIMYYNMS